jgi:hypothetical protein
MTPEELIDYRISQEASRVPAEIMATPDKDVREYASLIYIDDNGIVRHAPIQAGQTTSSSASTVGTRDYGQVVALVHSHTAAVFDPSRPVRSQYPTPDSGAGGQGDWYVFDWIRNQIDQALNSAAYQMKPAQRTARLALFRQYVLGPAGQSGSNAYKLHGFETQDREADTSKADDLGQEIDPELALCP